MRQLLIFDPSAIVALEEVGTVTITVQTKNELERKIAELLTSGHSAVRVIQDGRASWVLDREAMQALAAQRASKKKRF